MSRYYLLALIWLSAIPAVFAQDNYLKKENYNWITPVDAHDGIRYDDPVYPATGIDFNTSPFTTFEASGTYASYFGAAARSVASISDSNGALLFYTDGNIVWNRNHDVMENGWGINDNGKPPYHLASDNIGFRTESGSNWDGVVIVKKPGTRSKYFIFTIIDTLGYDSFFEGYTMAKAKWEGKLRYSVVDMEKGSGLGEVESENRAIVLAEGMSGNLHIVTGEDCNYWLVGNHSLGGFRSFNITANGVDPDPVVSVVVPPLQPYVQELNISPDRRTLAEAFEFEVSVCHFNPATGIVSDYTPAPVLLGTQTTFSMAFSPGSDKLYLGGIIGIRQYDLSGATPTFINPPISINDTLYLAPEYYGPLRLAPDGKIYFNFDMGLQHSGGVINDPELTGPACNLDSMVRPPLMFQRQAIAVRPFANETAVISYNNAGQVIQAPLCFQDSMVWLDPLQTPDTGTEFRWKMKVGDGYQPVAHDTQTIAVTTPGVYTVSFFTAAPCTFHEDTFIVSRVTFSLGLGQTVSNPVSCNGAPISLVPYTDAQSPAFIWQDGTVGKQYLADSSGTYIVSVTDRGCTAGDSVHVYITDVRQKLPADTVLCSEEPGKGLWLNALIPGGQATWEWSTGAADTAIYVTDSGLYRITVKDSSCIGTDSFQLDRRFCNCPVVFPTAFSPNGDGRNDLYRPALPSDCDVFDLQFEVYNRWGELVFVGNKAQSWDGTYNGDPAGMDTYFYRAQMTTGLNRKSITENGSFILVR